jgi:hypothetical protein
MRSAGTVFMLIFLSLPLRADAQISVRGVLAHDLQTTPGKSVSGSIIVHNDTTEPQQAKAYQRDYLFFADGTNDYAEPGTTERSNANWIRFFPENITIPPSASVSISYTVTVPDSINHEIPEGSFWSILMIEGIGKESAESTLGDTIDVDDRIGFVQVMRYGVQLATHIEKGSTSDVSVDGIELIADGDEGILFKADITNTGTLMLRPDVYLQVFDSDGVEYGPFNGTRFRIYPGTSVRQKIRLEGLQAGSYQALLVVDAGEGAIFGREFQLRL